MKEKTNIKKIIIIPIIFVLIIISCFVVYSIIKNNNNSNINKILVYTNNDHDLKYITTNNDKPTLLSKSYEEDIYVKFNTNKTKIAYLKNHGLYIKNVNDKLESTKIGVDVNYFKFLNNNEIVYQDINNNLYITSTKNKKEIDIDVNNIVYNKKDILIYNKGTELYLYNIKTEEKNAILKDYDPSKKIYVSDDLKQILYISDDANLKIYNLQSKETTIKSNNAYDIIDYSKDFSEITYSKLGEMKKYYDLIINDDSASNQKAKYECHFYDLDYDYANDEEPHNSDTKNNIYYLYETIDYYIYYDEQGQWHWSTVDIVNACNGMDPSQRTKDEIRQNEAETQLYSIYSLKNDENKEIANDVFEIISSKDNNVVYTKLDLNNNNKVNLSLLYSIEDYIDAIYNIKPNLYFTNKDKSNELLTESFNNDYKDNIKINNNKIYYYVENNSNLNLYEYDFTNSNKEKIADNGFIIDTNILGFDILYLNNYNSDTSKGDLIGRKNGNTKDIDIDIYPKLDSNNNYLYYYKDFDSKNKSGNYIINNIKKNKKESINDISIALRDKNNKYYLFKDYSATSNTYSLFRYQKGNQKPIEYNVTEFVYSK